jgi:hypothetical protein
MKKFIFGENTYVNDEQIAHYPNLFARIIRWFEVRKVKKIRRAKLNEMMKNDFDLLAEILIKPMKIPSPWIDIEKREN